jgi:hypothetical protein
MATIGLKANETQIHDDLDFNFDDFNMDVEEPKDNRHPIMKTLAPMARGAKDYITDSNNIEQFVKRAMPPGYGQAINLANDAKSELKQLYNNAAKEMRPVKETAKNVLRRALPALDGKIPKGLKKKLEEMSKEEEQWQGRQGDGREEQLGSLLTSIFEQRAQDEVRDRNVMNERDKLHQGFEQIRHRDQISQLDSIRIAVEAQTQYQNKITYTVQKKQLELSYRMFWAMADLNKEQKRSNAEMLTELKATRINTALPDYVKQRATEKFKEIARNKFLENAREGMFGGAQDYFRKFSKNLSEQVLSRVRTMSQTASAMGGAADMAGSMTEGMGDMPGFSARDEMIAMAMGLPMDYLAGKGADRLGKVLGKNKQIRRTGAALSRFTNTVGDRMREHLTDPNRNWGVLEGLRDMLASAAPSNVPDSKMEVDSIDRRHEAMPFARSNSKSLDEIIPGLLARIHREIKILRTGDESTELITYDFTKNKFSTDKKVAKDLRQRIAGNHTERATKYADQILKQVNRGGKLNEAQMAQARKTLIEKAVMGESLDIKNIWQGQNWGGGENGEAIAGAFNHYLRAKDGNLSHNQQGYLRQINIMQKHRGIVGGIGDPRVLIQQMVNAGQLEALKEMGILNEHNSIDRQKYAEWLMGDGTAAAGAGGPASTSGLPPIMGAANIGGLGAANIGGRRVSRTRNGSRPEDTPAASLRQSIPRTTASSPRGDEMLDELRTISATLRDRQTSSGAGSTVENNVQKIVDLLVAFDQKNDHIAEANYNTLDAMLKQLAQIASGRGGMGGGGGGAGSASSEEPGERGFTSLWEHASTRAMEGGAKVKEWAKRAGRRGGALWDRYSPGLKSRAKGAWDGANETLSNTMGRLQSYYGDVVVSGERYPRLRSTLLKAGEYRDKATGKVITSLEEITGDVVDASGNLVITMDEFYNSYVTGSVNKRVKEIFSGVKSKLEQWKDNLQDYMPGAIARTKARANALLSRVKKLLPPYDVYVKSDMQRPLLYANLMRAEKYFSQRTGKVISHPRELDGPVIDDLGNIVVSEEHIKEGLVDVVGDPAGPGKGRLGIKIGRKVKQAWETMRDAAVGIFGAIGKGFGNVGEYFKNFFAPFTDMITNSRKTVTLLEQIHEILDTRLPGGKKVRGDVDGDGIREGSVEDIRRKRAQAKAEAQAALQSGKGMANAPEGMLGKLAALFGKKKKDDDDDDDDDESLLDKAADIADIGDFLNGDGKNARGEKGSKARRKAAKKRLKRMKARGRPGMFGRLLGRGGAAAAGAGAAAEGASGLAGAASAGSTAARTAGAAGAAAAGGSRLARAAKWGMFNTDLVRGAGRVAAPVAGTAAAVGGGLLRGGAKVAGKVGGALMGPGTVGKVARWGMFNTDIVRGMGKGAGYLMKGAKFLPRALGLAGTAYSGYSAYDNFQQGNYGEAALDAGMAGLGVATTVGGLGGLAGAAGAIAGGVGAVLASPLLVPALAVAATAGALYMGYKYFTKTKLTDLSKLRLAQYGVNPEDKDAMGKIFELESELEPYVSMKDGKVSVDQSKVDTKEIAKIFEVKSGDDLPLFNGWYKRRFLPVWTRWLSDIRKYAPDAKLSNVESVIPGKDKLKVATASANGMKDVYTYMAGWSQARPKLDFNEAGVMQVLESIRMELMKAAERDGGPKAAAGAAPRSSIAATSADASHLAEKAINNTANYEVKDKDGKVLDANAIGYTALREKIIKGEVTINAAAAIPKDVIQTSKSTLDALTSVRYKAYGLTYMTADKARMLYALEMLMGDHLSSDTDNPKLNISTDTVLEVAGKVFGVPGQSGEHAERWKAWFNGRFLPVFLIWSGTIRKQTGKPKLKDAIDAFPMTEQAALARAIIGAKGTNSFGASSSVWNVTANPWPDNFEMNTDPDSAAGNLEAIRIVADKVKLGEVTATNGKTHRQSKEVSDAETGWLGSIKKKVGGWFGKDWSPKGEGAQAAGDTILAKDAKPLSGIGDVIKFGSGGGGNYTTLPASKGTGWGNNKDLLLGAAKMAGVDPKGLVSLIAMESGFDPNAAPKNPNLPSSAKGFGQHLDGTWLEDLQRDGSKFGIPNGTSQFDPRASAVMTAAHMKFVAGSIQKSLGRPVTLVDVYLAHLMGPAGATKFLKAPPDAIAAEVAPTSAKQHPNYFYENGKPLTVKQVCEVIAKKIASRAAQYGVQDKDLTTTESMTTVAPGAASLPQTPPAPGQEPQRQGQAQASGPTVEQGKPKVAASYENTPSAGSPRLSEPITMDKGKAAQLGENGAKPLKAGMNYELILQREDSEEDGTYGTLRFPDGTVLNTLELPWRDNQARISCIPPGSYQCKKRSSAAFGEAYEVGGVPGRSAILIHAGNAAGSADKGMKADSQGCILLGMDRGKKGNQKVITASKAAMKLFYEKMGDQPFKLTVRPGKNNLGTGDSKSSVSFDPVRQPAANSQVAQKSEVSPQAATTAPSFKPQGPNVNTSGVGSQVATSSDLPRLNTTDTSFKPGGPSRSDMQQRDASMANVIAPKLDGMGKILSESLETQKEGVGVLKKILESLGNKEEPQKTPNVSAGKVKPETSTSVPVPQRRNF